MSHSIDKQKCVGCGACVGACPVEAIKIENEKAVVDADTCVSCGACEGECPTGAITIE